MYIENPFFLFFSTKENLSIINTFYLEKASRLFISSFASSFSSLCRGKEVGEG